jgi:biopolymer transport protein ExbD
MAFSIQNANGDVLSEMNTTPLIDVMLVLLTLLIITLPMQTHAVKLTMPNSPPPLQPPIPVVMLEVDFDGSTIWNGWRISDAVLERKLADSARQDPQPEIHMMANRLARYGAVVKVMAAAERRGLTRIGLVDTQKY